MRGPAPASSGNGCARRLTRVVAAAATIRRIIAFSRADSGATAVEFGMVAGPTLLMLCAILGIGMNFFMVASLDHAALVGARAITTGSVSTAGMSASTFKQNVVCPALPSLFSCNDVFVNVTVVQPAQSPSGYYTLVNTNQSGLIQPALDSSKNTFCPGAASQYVVLQVLYPAPIFFSYLTPSPSTVYNGHNVAVMMASTTFLSEPYSGAQAYQGC